MKRLVVHLNGQRVGVLTDADEPDFIYDGAWLASPAARALSRQLPLRSEVFTGRAVRGFFGGLLPEADSRERIASILGVSGGNDFALLERIGGECAGAVSLRSEEETPAPPTGNGKLRWLSDGELANIVERLPQRPLLAGVEGLRLSLAGAQIKLPVVIAGDSPREMMRVALPVDDTPTTHIIKPEPGRFPGLVANEAWCLELARRIGLAAAEAWTQSIADTPCLIIKRYDRVTDPGGMTRRLHQEDFCQALGYPSNRKYQQEGGPSLRECFALVREWSTAPVLDIKRLLDAVIFAAITGNADAHAKNHSLLYSDGSRRMAPLYDQVCTLAWPELSKTLSMKIGSASSLPEVSPEHFKQLCAEAKLGWPMVRERLAALCAKVAEVGRELEIQSPSLTPDGAAPRHVLSRAERMLRLVQCHS